MFVTVLVTLVGSLLGMIATGASDVIYFVGIVGMPIALVLYVVLMSPGLWLFTRIFCTLQARGVARIASCRVAAALVTGLIAVLVLLGFWLVGDPAGPISGVLILAGPAAVAAWGSGVFISTEKAAAP